MRNVKRTHSKKIICDSVFGRIILEKTLPCGWALVSYIMRSIWRKCLFAQMCSLMVKWIYRSAKLRRIGALLLLNAICRVVAVDPIFTCCGVSSQNISRQKGWKQIPSVARDGRKFLRAAGKVENSVSREMEADIGLWNINANVSCCKGPEVLRCKGPERGK